MGILLLRKVLVLYLTMKISIIETRFTLGDEAKEVPINFYLTPNVRHIMRLSFIKIFKKMYGDQSLSRTNIKNPEDHRSIFFRVTNANCCCQSSDNGSFYHRRRLKKVFHYHFTEETPISFWEKF